jgi:uncharacterized cupredoxin-like copper-binding protein
MMNKALLLMLSLASTATFASSEMNHMNHRKMDHNMMTMSSSSAVGLPAMGAKADKVVHVILSDNQPVKFKKQVEIAPNDVVQFVVMNTGKHPHEFAIGSQGEIIKHQQMMEQMVGMEHDTDSSIIVEAKKARQFTWHFHGDNQVTINCTMSGHSHANQPIELSL